MRIFIASQFTYLSISLLMGGFLALMPQNDPAQAQVYEYQAPLDLNEIPMSKQALPQLQPMQPGEFNQNNRNYQPSQVTQISQYNQNFERYFVYVDDDNPQTLQRIRQIENTAYIRQYGGRKIIQAGVFTKPSNAQQRIRELELSGIYGANFASVSNNETVVYNSPKNSDILQLSYYSPTYNAPTTNNNYRRENPTAYYVIIPSSSNNLRNLGEQVRRSIGQNSNVWMRTQPRGAHIAVGPFRERPEAEQWNDYIKKLGYGNARVYYGR
ncbi:hypothetical protein A0J48_016545 [Sphaerospermopsis aphanizomenoides BCCUSP55]|uniref:hypothetical protein n=1 Tax=Sphaerospermopsis aphanizomenoides TaxID=459663 RepID=UPI001907F302|nr:hypothetical protein [Sphaerospermopsis aphanizomenoides]MBK1989128.1 hypothetical protein [Sphaerospermopsis aphanizomenoides BCCUSP55]